VGSMLNKSRVWSL